MEEDKFQFHFYEPKFPNDGIEWREEYAPCSFERLFLPVRSILTGESCIAVVAVASGTAIAMKQLHFVYSQ